jgi:ribose transport system permease protein
MSDDPKGVPAEPAPAWRFAVPWPLLGLLVILAVFAVLLYRNYQLENFLSWGNVQGLLYLASMPALIGLGMLLVIVSGGIDLSVGSVVGLVTVTTMLTHNEVLARTGSAALAGWSAVAAGVATGGLCGLTNGLAVTGLRVSPFVATLGMFGVAYGLAVWLLPGGRPVTFADGTRPGWVRAVQSASPEGWAGVSPVVWGTLALAGLVALLLRRTVFGRYVYAVGSNEATARLCGVPVTATKLGVYALAGLLTGCAGVLVFARISSGDANAGRGQELNVIAAVVVGGASLTGGRGTVAGTLLGVLALAALERAVNFLEATVELKYILVGVIVVVSTALSQWQRRPAA